MAEEMRLDLLLVSRGLVGGRDRAKELILQTDCPYIVARGRKGGSNVAAAICNALLYIASQDARE